MDTEIKIPGVTQEVTVNQPNLKIEIKKGRIGRPRRNLTKRVAFINGIPRKKGKPKSGEIVEWREVAWDFKSETK